MLTKKLFLSPCLFLFLDVFVSLVVLSSCSPKKDKLSLDSTLFVLDTTTHTVDHPNPVQEEDLSSATDFIRYGGATQDDVHKALEIFSPFASVEALTRKYIALHDSLEVVREQYGQSLTNPADTLMVLPFKERAYQAIVNYKKQMASGPTFKHHCPNILELNRVLEAGDSSLHLLPKTEPSNVLSQGNFFFLGGAPFISQVSSEDTDVFIDPQGKPEIRFATTLTENASYLLTSVYCARPGPLRIDYGPPLYTSEMGPAEVHGIGSLIHVFTPRVPAYFITESGLVPGHLLSVKLNLGDEYNCGEGPTYIEFACAASLESSGILAIFIPYGASPVSCKVERLSNHVWTADLNNDGIPDLACVSDTYSGTSSDTIAEELWFANINGTWTIIDWGYEPECT
jgi:hypothetical protein